jgi:proteasome lid subunit RPN8/RPN11
MSIRLPERVISEIRLHTENAYPEEAAGFLLGRELDDVRIIQTVLPQSNQYRADQRSRRYLIDAKDMLSAENYADEQGFEILGIFHSHPDHPAEPSSFDLEWSLPHYSYLISSVENGELVTSRCWRLNEDRTGYYEEEIDVTKSFEKDIEEQTG